MFRAKCPAYFAADPKLTRCPDRRVEPETVASLSGRSTYRLGHSNRADTSFPRPTAFKILEPFGVEGTDLPHPGSRSLSRFRVVFGFPRSRSFPKDIALATQLDFAPGYFGRGWTALSHTYSLT